MCKNTLAFVFRDLLMWRYDKKARLRQVVTGQRLTLSVQLRYILSCSGCIQLLIEPETKV